MLVKPLYSLYVSLCPTIPDVAMSSIDGGINDETVKLINTDIVVSGSFICQSDDYNEQISKLKKDRV